MLTAELVIWGLGTDEVELPGCSPPACTQVCFSESKESPCLEAISCSTINQALKEDTSSYHHITTSLQERAHFFFGPEIPCTSSENTSQTKLPPTPHTYTHTSSKGLVKLDSLYVKGLQMNLSNLNFSSLPPHFSQGASRQAEWGAIPSGISRHTMQSNFVPPHSITVISVSQGQ